MADSWYLIKANGTERRSRLKRLAAPKVGGGAIPPWKAFIGWGCLDPDVRL